VPALSRCRQEQQNPDKLVVSCTVNK
jgi:hypothetical protein